MEQRLRWRDPPRTQLATSTIPQKKKQYALNVLLVVLLSGVIIFCSPPFPKMNDQSLFNEFDIRQRFIGKPWGLIADSGFTLNSVAAQESDGNIIADRFTGY